jgi:phosphatidylglycerol:prolipoprotein diacylglycerol transferase
MHPLIPYFEPFVLDLGIAKVHAFGILVALGFLIGGNVAQAKAVRFTGDPKAAERVNRLVGWLVFGTFIGGHLGDVLFYRPAELADDPELFGKMMAAFASGRLPRSDEIPLVLRLWEGLSSFGGFSVCVPLCIWFFRKEKVNVWPYLDALAIAFSLGWFFGRMGCFSAHDHPGGETNFWLGVYGMTRDANGAILKDIATHDLGLYEALWSGAVYLLFLRLDTKPRFHGFYVSWIAALYGPFRFFLDFGRSSAVDEGGRYMGLTPAQYGSIVVTALAVWMLATRSKTAVKQAAWPAA